MDNKIMTPVQIAVYYSYYAVIDRIVEDPNWRSGKKTIYLSIQKDHKEFKTVNGVVDRAKHFAQKIKELTGSPDLTTVKVRYIDTMPDLEEYLNRCFGNDNYAKRIAYRTVTESPMK